MYRNYHSGDTVRTISPFTSPHDVLYRPELALQSMGPLT